MQLAPHTPWQRVLCPNAGSNTPLSAVAKGGATQCSPNSAVQEAVGRAHGAEQSQDRGAARAGDLWGGRGGWWLIG